MRVSVPVGFLPCKVISRLESVGRLVSLGKSAIASESAMSFLRGHKSWGNRRHSIKIEIEIVIDA